MGRAELQAELNRVRKEATDAQEALQPMRQELASLQAAHQSLQHDFTVLQQRAAEGREEYAVLHNSHAQTKSALEAALQAQEAYRKEYYATRSALEKSRGELAKQAEELGTLRAERVPLEEGCKRAAEFEGQL